MTELLAVKTSLRRLWTHISPRRRLQLTTIAGLMALSTLAEVASIGAVLPFLGALSAPQRVFEHVWAQPFVKVLRLTEPQQLLLPLTIVFGLAALFSGFARLALLWGQTRLANAIGVDLGSAAFRRTLYQPYPIHVVRNSSEVVAGLVTKVSTIVHFIIVPFLTVVTSGFIVGVVLALMMWIEPLLTLAAVAGLGAMYTVVGVAIKNRLGNDSQQVTAGQSHVTQVVQEGLGGIRDVLIDGLQETYSQLYRQADGKLRRALASITILSGAPRPIIEAVAVVVMGGLAYALAGRPEGMATAIPLLGALALAAQRLLPLVQQAYAGWTSMLGGQASLRDVLTLLDQPLPPHSQLAAPTPIPFRHDICLHDVHFRYTPAGSCVLRGINLRIPRGSRVGFIGPTGSGKSTLLDIVMGLLAPTRGTLRVDDVLVDNANCRAWQAHIAHVPQAIFLADTTVAENIAFGIPHERIDHVRLHRAAQRAQIADTIRSLTNGYDTFVGERGIRLSGGQRQRIGIARALYRQADVIVFDEATSALDDETEKAVMESIDALDKDLTILIVAHRLSTVQKCDQIIELSDGVVKEAKSERIRLGYGA